MSPSVIGPSGSRFVVGGASGLLPRVTLGRFADAEPTPHAGSVFRSSLRQSVAPGGCRWPGRSSRRRGRSNVRLLSRISIIGRSVPCFLNRVGDRLRQRFHCLRALFGSAPFGQEMRRDNPLCRLDSAGSALLAPGFRGVTPPAASCSLMSSMSSRHRA
jgi:hypothetical protein